MGAACTTCLRQIVLGVSPVWMEDTDRFAWAESITAKRWQPAAPDFKPLPGMLAGSPIHVVGHWTNTRGTDRESGLVVLNWSASDNA
jgi:hypothetical protein